MKVRFKAVLILITFFFAGLYFGWFFGMKYGVDSCWEDSLRDHVDWVLVSEIKGIEIFNSLDANDILLARKALLDEIENNYYRIHSVIGSQVIESDQRFTQLSNEINDFLHEKSPVYRESVIR